MRVRLRGRVCDECSRYLFCLCFGINWILVSRSRKRGREIWYRLRVHEILCRKQPWEIFLDLILVHV